MSPRKFKFETEDNKIITDLDLEKEYEADLKAQALDTGKWIMIRMQLPPMEFSPPPPLSIHWSLPWPMGKESIMHQKHQNLIGLAWGGISPNCLTARKIVFDEHEFRIFDHEFVSVTVESMRLYVYGVPNEEEPSHSLRPARGLAEQKIIMDILEGERRQYYDAAVMDGATDAQAFMTAMELDVLSAVEFPPMGWYECKPEFIEVFIRSEPELEPRKKQAVLAGWRDI